MDHKTWLWRKRSSEKTIVANDKDDLSLKGSEEELLPTERKVGLERSAKNLNEKFASVLCDCNAKEDFVTKHVKMAQEATAGLEKAEAEAVFLKQELDEALQQRVAAEERLTQLDATLKECVQQLSSVREEQEQRIHDAVMKTSREFEKVQKKLEEQLTERSKRLASLAVENTHLSKALLVKEKLIEDLSKRKSQAKAEFNTLMARLDSSEKENAFLRYEFRMLEKEFEIRNEEREFNRRSADASQKQHLESVKKITKLEAECQRLRLLVRKRLPGPSALVKMKSEVEMLGRDLIETRRRKKFNPTGGLILRDTIEENSPQIPSKRISFLIERLCDVEEENKNLKEILTKKNDEIRSSRIICARTASKLAQVEAQLGELSKGKKCMELARCSPISNELSPKSGFDIGKEDEVSCSGSWANALIWELEHFRNGKPKNPPECKTIGVSDMRLMDDFVEMEKLAIVSLDTPFGSSYAAPDASTALANTFEEPHGYHSVLTGMELVPVVQGHGTFGDTNQEIQSKDVSIGKSCDWLQDVLNVILEQNHVSKRSLDELLDDIRIALAYMNHPSASEADTAEISRRPRDSDPLHISSYITWKSPSASPMMDTLYGVPSIDISAEDTSNQHIQSDLSKSICKIIELIEGINPTTTIDNNTPDHWSERKESPLPYKNSAKPADYLVRVFRWKSSELSVVLRQFIHTCNDLLNGKADLKKFAAELTSALDWTMNNCITGQDTSSVRDKIKKHFGWDGSRSESELNIGVDDPFLESDNVHVSKQQSLCLPLVSSSSSQNGLIQFEKSRSNLQEENRGLKDESKNMESEKKDLEVGLQSETDKSESLMIQLRESEQSIGSLKTELETLKQSKGMIEDQIENQKLINEDLETQLTVAKVKLNEVLQKVSSLEVELEDKSHCCEELEGTCLELQLQLESVTKKEIPEYNADQEGKQLQTGWEITAASVKLAECQETILNLGKQLKALASPREVALFDKVFSTTTTTTNNKNLSKRSSLRDRMLAEDGVRDRMLAKDDVEAEVLKSPRIKEIISSVDTQKPSNIHSDNCNALLAPRAIVEPPQAYIGSMHRAGDAAAGALAIAPSKKQGGGGGFLRKLLLRRKRGSTKKRSLSFGT